MNKVISLFSTPIIFASVAAFIFCAGPSRAADTNSPAQQMWQQDYGPTREERMQWWRDAKFGMFIHWGVYSVPAGVYKGQPVPRLGEWIMRTTSIPVADY